ncbi:MAG: hypothetical protein ACTSRU_07315 [Candidatus Hodarchaeales archaeon]
MSNNFHKEIQEELPEPVFKPWIVIFDDLVNENNELKDQIEEIQSIVISVSSNALSGYSITALYHARTEACEKIAKLLGVLE